jgi:3-hydroxyisobutyrate dehydrogenase-like beta-hydroxyacid dehydrogenase
MGHGIGKNILARGFDLTVMGHRNRAPVDDLVSRGAKERSTPRETATDADLVILCVTGTPQIEQLVYGRDGLLAAVHDGLVIADCSTAEPVSTVRIAPTLKRKAGILSIRR